MQGLETCAAIERIRMGRGEILRVKNFDAFDRYVMSIFPIGLEEPSDVPSDRIAAVRALGDAKATSRGRYEGVFLRSMKPDTAILNESGASLDITRLTELWGVAAITLDDSRSYRFSGRLVIVENAEPFWKFEDELPDVDLAIYSAGRLSERVLSWLASKHMAGCEIAYWGDYDPVGCLEYLRIQSRCGQRVGLHAPSRVDELLPVHGKRSLLDGQITELTSLRGRSLPPELKRLMELFDQHRRGLEQEALLM